MFTNLQGANINYSSWLLKESRIYVFSKKDMKNKITFY